MQGAWLILTCFPIHLPVCLSESQLSRPTEVRGDVGRLSSLLIQPTAFVGCLWERQCQIRQGPWEVGPLRAWREVLNFLLSEMEDVGVFLVVEQEGHLHFHFRKQISLADTEF